MKLAALVEAEDHVCCRYRLAAFRAPLAAAGHSLDLFPTPQSWFARLNLGSSLASYDAVILQRKLLPALAIRRLSKRVSRLLFDFDDAVWLRDSHSPKGFDDPRRARRFRSTIEACDLVIAGNEYLAAEARRHIPAERVAIIPTCVVLPDLGQGSAKISGGHDKPERFLGGTGFQPVQVKTHRLEAGATQEHPTSPVNLAALIGPRQQTSSLQIVWVGSSSTLRGLERFMPTLSAIGRAVPGTRLKLICDRFIDIPDLPVDRCQWNEATEAAEIAAADVGIGWVPDDPWSRGKCGLKVLQYQAAGLPVIANPVGVQADLVRDGATGFSATTTEEWVKAVRRLAVDAELRQRLGAAGRRQVEAKYSVAAGAALWISALQRLAKPLAA
ncbi:MAG TPA: glycosyltransferase [Urbifossiella sp.]|nr:glycosyltransferase [Urbifossiella sp.]